jgi:hypothetical protein
LLIHEGQQTAPLGGLVVPLRPPMATPPAAHLTLHRRQHRLLPPMASPMATPPEHPSLEHSSNAASCLLDLPRFTSRQPSSTGYELPQTTPRRQTTCPPSGPESTLMARAGRYECGRAGTRRDPDRGYGRYSSYQPPTRWPRGTAGVARAMPRAERPAAWRHDVASRATDPRGHRPATTRPNRGLH